MEDYTLEDLLSFHTDVEQVERERSRKEGVREYARHPFLVYSAHEGRYMPTARYPEESFAGQWERVGLSLLTALILLNKVDEFEDRLEETLGEQ